MGTAYRGRDDEIRALNTYIKLMRAANSLTSRLAPLMKDAGLTPSQFGLLEALYHLGPLCQRAIGEKLLTSGGNVTMVVDNLEKRKLVRRERSEQDRRYITVHLTAQGRQLIEKIFPRHVASILKEMEVLTKDEQEELGRLCRILGRAEGCAAPEEGGPCHEGADVDGRDHAGV
jgi:MarR family 2-MHQ and catechol resistance regulon transcriptional repressor